MSEGESQHWKAMIGKVKAMIEGNLKVTSAVQRSLYFVLNPQRPFLYQLRCQPSCPLSGPVLEPWAYKVPHGKQDSSLWCPCAGCSHRERLSENWGRNKKWLSNPGRRWLLAADTVTDVLGEQMPVSWCLSVT